MPTYQTIAMPATHQVLTSGVWCRGWMRPSRDGSACRRAIDRPVREAGMIVVCVEAIAEVATAKNTTQSQPPITCEAISAKTNSSSSALSVSHWVPAKATTAKATAT